MKKLLICIILTVLSVSCQSHATPIIKITPALIDPDGTFTFGILIEDVSDFGAFQFDLVYDSTVVTIDDIVLGEFLGSTERNVWELPVGNAPGVLSFGAFSGYLGEGQAPGGAEGDGPLANVTFSLKNQTDTTLEFEENSSYITDTAGNPLAAQWVGAEIIACTCRIAVTGEGEGTIRSDGGTVSSGETVMIRCGTEQRFEFEPDSCYDFADVSADGVSLGAESSHTFNCTDDGDYTIHAVFSATPPHTIKTEAGEGGSISPSGNVSAGCGSDQGFEITPDQCHHIADVAVNGSSVGPVASYRFGNVSEDHTISASFALNGHSIGASAGSGGSIKPSGTIPVPCGDKTFTITPDPGYHIENVLTDGSSQGQVSTYAFANITGDHTIHADFAPDPLPECTMTASAEGSGQISPSGDVTATCGSDKTFTITPDNCNHIKDVFVNGESVGPMNSYKFINVTDGETIHAVFEENVYHINASTNDGGTIVPSGEVAVKCGTEKCFTITPDECRHIADVRIDGDSVEVRESYCFTNLTGNHTIEAVFATDIHTVTATSEGCGTIDPAGETDVECGADKKFTFTPEICCVVDDVRVNGKSVGPMTGYTFENVKSDHHRIHAVFAEAPPFVIKAGAGEGGIITPSGDTEVECGAEEVCFTVTPDGCYRVADIRIDGDSVGASDSYCFTDVIRGREIAAVFDRITTAPGDADANGTVDLADAVSALKLLCNVNIGEGNIAMCADVSGDGKIGMEEVIYILTRIAESDRPSP